MQKEVNSKKKTKTHKKGCFCCFLSLFLQQKCRKKTKNNLFFAFSIACFCRSYLLFFLFSKVSFPGVLLWFALFFGWWIRFSHKFTCHCNILKCIIFSLQVWQCGSIKKGCFFPTKGWSTGFSWILSISNFPNFPHQALGVARRRERKSGSSLVNKLTFVNLWKFNDLREKNGLFELFRFIHIYI